MPSHLAVVSGERVAKRPGRIVGLWRKGGWWCVHWHVEVLGTSLGTSGKSSHHDGFSIIRLFILVPVLSDQARVNLASQI